MNTTESRLVTFLGFCIKSKKIAIGVDNAEKLKRAHLILFEESLSENSVKQVKSLAERWKCPAYILQGEGTLGQLLHKNGCKMIAVTDENLAKAAIGCMDDLNTFSPLQGVGGNS